MGKIGSYSVVVATTFAFGTCASAQSVTTAQRVNVIWGDKVPAAARSIRAGASVANLVRELGAPYATYTVGDKIIYRWGQGTVQGNDARLVRRHNELLVTTDRDGKILDSSYRPKFQQVGRADWVFDAPF